MVTTRVGFVLSSHVTVRDVSYQGVDTIRPNDNGALCGGGAFETKGCAENDCSKSGVNNGGSDGLGVSEVILENIRLNDFYYQEDKYKVGASVAGNYDCPSRNVQSNGQQCCFCKPNGVRASQVAVYVPETRDATGTRRLLVQNIVSSATQGDGINLHGFVRDAIVRNIFIQNTGDDVYALWGAALDPQNVTFQDVVGVNPGILRPNWYGNCAATYGLRSVLFRNMTCRTPILQQPLPNFQPDTTMLVLYTSFGGVYPKDNQVVLDGWTFEDLEGNPHTAADGYLYNGSLVTGKMAWTQSDNGVLAPYFSSSRDQHVNVQVRNTTGGGP